MVLVECFILSLFLCVVRVASSLRNLPVVQTSYGAVRGYEYEASNGFKGEIFKKIPYAAPPIGALRWKKPQPPRPWNYTTDGTFFGPSCAQRHEYWEGSITGFSEDCLHANIYSSKKCREASSSCPVVFYIHGGVVLFDGAQMFPDDELVSNFAAQGIVIVTFNFRLGIFGAMALGDENALPANLALHDCVESLHFVRKEIHNFGGDKDKITVMGHSSGADIALLFAFSPGMNKPGEQLFSQVIAMSSSGVFEHEDRQIMRSHSQAAAMRCKGSPQEIIDCLMPLSTENILEIANRHGGSYPYSDTQISSITLAGELLPIEYTPELRENMKPIKMLLGTSLNEFELESLTNRVKREKTSDNFMKVAKMSLGIKNVEECYQKYVSDRESGEFATDHTTETESVFINNWLFANALANVGGEVYLYQYDYPAHACHAEGAYYLMGLHPHSKDENEEWLSRVFPTYFINFIKGLPLAPDWDPVNHEIMNYYSINNSFTDGIVPTMKHDYHKRVAAYYLETLKLDESLIKERKEMLTAPVEYTNAAFSSTKDHSCYTDAGSEEGECI